MKILTPGETIYWSEKFGFIPFEIQIRRNKNGHLTGEWDRFTVMHILLTYISTNPCRLSTSFIWPYPLETRNDIPIWVRLLAGDGSKMPWRYFSDLRHLQEVWPLRNTQYSQVVAADPRNPDVPPPVDFTPTVSPDTAHPSAAPSPETGSEPSTPDRSDP